MIRSRRFLAMVLAAVGASSSCCPSPAIAPGGNGVFARYLPEDPATPAVAPDSQSGEVAQADVGWPPTPLARDCAEGRDELGDFEKALGVRESDPCPSFQAAAVPAVTVTPDSGHIGAPRPLDHNRYCFAQGHALIVVETTERTSTRCTHVVTVAVYPKAGK